MFLGALSRWPACVKKRRSLSGERGAVARIVCVGSDGPCRRHGQPSAGEVGTLPLALIAAPARASRGGDCEAGPFSRHDPVGTTWLRPLQTLRLRPSPGIGVSCSCDAPRGHPRTQAGALFLRDHRRMNSGVSSNRAANIDRLAGAALRLQPVRSDARVWLGFLVCPIGANYL